MEEAGIFAIESSYLDSYVQLGIASGRVISLSFPRSPDADAGTDHPVLDRIKRYLEGTKEDFADIETALTMPTDRRQILETLRGIPYGEQISVEQLVRMTPGLDPDDEGDIETARSALADNPIPLIIPDHRVRDGPSGAPPGVEQKLRSLENL
ncbi:MAG: methylated-DNA--[protein]-cysteine S-methyltransferase [Halobacteriales archaeon]